MNIIILEEQMLAVSCAHTFSNFLPQGSLEYVMFQFVTQENDKGYYVMGL